MLARILQRFKCYPYYLKNQPVNQASVNGHIRAQEATKLSAVHAKTELQKQLANRSFNFI